ncbi:MAG: EAL domain-containing protein [Nitrosomonas sp.]|jgi:diguanylate cyclase (GGDEF)-like protein/PAS domain S-box-containing protein|uniref:EAL domain-containing protein n=1 Tax=Nitrosomonas sp. TaxID=42353 RepID=UPI0027193BD7|nr:EAL domain-containing protein [Nitrosomonas sp.]MDO8895306.1 EAL domain-containing protein [Nitrosomonas sp.]MDP1550706.1 EAL domain-containing protein [Nitrosomonas sp.]MDP1786938.1 EAL domain-containing protein [Nitrosomonas sp.]MDP1933528.1 EAL domain-containing protein [Nitrosomonas sp.]MDP2225676.1 EAL domain-containing protein [Nitrosomonas sp.]
MIEANRSSAIGYLTLTQTGQILEINPVASQLLGMERDKLLQRDFSAFVVSEDQDRWRLCASKHNEQGNLQLLLQCYDGSALQVQLQYMHQSDEAGSPIIRIFLFESMQHKQLEAALSARSKREEHLFLFSPVIVYTCDIFSPYSAKFISTNLTKILGYTVEEFLSMPNFWADHLHPEDRNRVFANFPLLYFSGMQLHEYRFKHRDGSWKWIRDELYMLPGMNGNSIEVIGYRSDITESREKEVALSESRNLLKTIVDTVPAAGIFWKDKELHYLGCNPNFAKDAGVESPREIIGKVDYDLSWTKEQAELYRHDDRQVIDSGIPKLNYEESLNTPDGKTIWLQTSKIPLRNTYQEVIGVLGIYQDITEQKQANDSMRLATAIYQFGNEAIMVTDENNLIMAVNPAFTRITGYELTDVIGKDPRIFQSGRHKKAFYQKMWQKLLSEDHWQGEIWDMHKNGSIQAKWLNISIIRQSNERIYCYVAQFSDITEKKKLDELYLAQANYDELTRLPNRNLFKYQLNKEIRKSRRNGSLLSLLFLDLDHFKDINDTLGHAIGDKLLKEVSLRITKCVRETDTVARLGGDEFAVILPDISRSRIETIAQNIIQILNEPFILDQNQVEQYISTSIGIVLYPQDGADIESLMKHADQAMYKAKMEGRGRFCYFTRSMQYEAFEKMILTHHLRSALVNNELQVYYQPILDLFCKRIIKAEALLRWKHPERGMIEPSIFIPLAEESGLIQEIGEWVFQQVCFDIKQWFNVFGYLIQVSVNVSPIQFKYFSNHSWSASLAQLGLPGNSINVEITEGLLLKDASNVKERLLEYRNAGIEVSIDDFGTGFSSLSYLKKFDIDYLKIDRSFISNLINNETDRALVEAIIVMAHKLDINTIAEGVETMEQQDLLIQFGCDYAQGFYYSEAISVLEFEKLLVDQQN